MEGIHDKSMLEKSPQVLEYERRNRIKHEGYRRNAPERNVKLLSHTRTGGTDVAKSLSTLRQDLLSASTDAHSFNSIQASDHVPAPPTAPKPDTSQQGTYRNRRRALRVSTQLDRDISVHNQSKEYNKPRPPSAEVQIDWEADVKEALRVERELEDLHKALVKQKNTDMPYFMEMMHPSTPAKANSNMPGHATPCVIPTAAVPYNTSEPVKSWNNDTAKRGLGFKSRVKEEQEKRELEKRKSNVGRLMPEKIRKEMKKYFN
ncbi:uncharacterized protein LOC132744587 [Ruditapes philippinarum]|uniref:uncharacterized protein LOC132744587 n=1 Tax=Ruditapes philippinarum TaxID=129788 RepID=UPI00295AFBBC|nr:uncharacterized protein LOC132744587 [Ruditapes philippinarum]